MHRFHKIKSAISKLYESNPSLANSITGFITFFAGDITSQILKNKQFGKENDSATDSISGDLNNSNINRINNCNDSAATSFSSLSNIDPDPPREIHVSRALTTGILGILMNGGTLTIYYRLLDKAFGASSALKSVAAKMVVDQIVYAPFAILVFFAHSTNLEKDFFTNFKLAAETFRSKCSCLFWQTYLADCTLWPLVNFVNFRYIPLNYRPSFVSVAQYLWQTYLSSVSFGHSKTTKSETASSPSSHMPTSTMLTAIADTRSENTICNPIATPLVVSSRSDNSVAAASIGSSSPTHLSDNLVANSEETSSNGR